MALPTIFATAINRISPNCSWYVKGEETYSNLVWADDNKLSKPSKEDLVAMMAIIEQERLDIAYKSKRALEYPSIQEQLDMQYWDSVNGTTTWQDAINAVKAKYPKPEGV